jgi:glycosyltransferase involved in cell wall biosynthesis
MNSRALPTFRSSGTTFTREGFPQMINEALCVGLPIVATAVGEIPSVLVDGETALLVVPADAEALARGLERMLRDRATKAVISQWSPVDAEQHACSNRARIIQILNIRKLLSTDDRYRSALTGYPAGVIRQTRARLLFGQCPEPGWP